MSKSSGAHLDIWNRWFQSSYIPNVGIRVCLDSERRHFDIARRPLIDVTVLTLHQSRRYRSVRNREPRRGVTVYLAGRIQTEKKNGGSIFAKRRAGKVVFEGFDIAPE